MLSEDRSDDYDSWYQVGLALKREFGEDGFELWHEFSSRSDKYDEVEADVKWSSLGAGEHEDDTLRAEIGPRARVDHPVGCELDAAAREDEIVQQVVAREVAEEHVGVIGDGGVQRRAEESQTVRLPRDVSAVGAVRAHVAIDVDVRAIHGRMSI